MRIGSFSQACGLSPKALRHYDRLGLLRPHSIDPATGYRAYHPDQLAEAELIRALTGIGIGLAEVRRVIESRRTDAVEGWAGDVAVLLERECHSAEMRLRQAKELIAVHARASASLKWVSTITERILGLPAGAVLRWGDPTASAKRPFVLDWVGVQAPRIQPQEERGGRVWLVAAPDDRLGIHHVPELTIRAEPDLDVHSVWDPRTQHEVLAAAVPRGGAMAAAQGRRLRSTAKQLGVAVSVSPAWSVATVSALVSAWIEQNCGRGDISVRYDPRIPALAETPAAVRAMGFANLADFIAVVRTGRGDVEVGRAAMVARDRSAAAARILSRRHR